MDPASCPQSSVRSQRKEFKITEKNLQNTLNSEPKLNDNDISSIQSPFETEK